MLFWYHVVSSDGIDGVDVEERIKIITFAAGETMISEQIEIFPDNVTEEDEYFSVSLVQKPGFLLGSPNFEFLIIQDDSKNSHNINYHNGRHKTLVL